jgi:hypothetical protein
MVGLVAPWLQGMFGAGSLFAFFQSFAIGGWAVSVMTMAVRVGLGLFGLFRFWG